MAILDSVDKAITVIHLLTNNQWGSDVAQFLSCRQGVATRDKLRAWGDRMIVSDITRLSMKRLTKSIQTDLETFYSHKSLVDSLRELKYLFEIRCTTDGVVAIIDLLPSLNRAVDSTLIATILLSTIDRPIVKLHPFLKILVDKQYELVVQVGDSVESLNDMAQPISEEESALDELMRCRRAALDYAIISSMHDEIRDANSIRHGWVVVNTSRSIDSLSIVVMTSSGSEIRLSLSRPGSPRSTDPHTRYLRHQFLERCCSTKASSVGLLSRFLDYLIQSNS